MIYIEYSDIFAVKIVKLNPTLVFFFRASGSCSHIIGLLMALQHWILMGFKAVPDNLTCTSLPQQWSVPRGSKIESSAAPQICIINFDRMQVTKNIIKTL